MWATTTLEDRISGKYYEDKKKRIRNYHYRYEKSEEAKRKIKEYYKQDYIKNYKKYKATNEINRAIKKGVLIRKPCIICGKIPTHGHHSNYDKPLSVIWLCPLHHRQIHRKSNYRRRLNT